MKKFAIGIDLGGTYTKLALVSPKGKIVERGRLSTADHPTRDGLLRAIVSGIDTLLKDARVPRSSVKGVGIGVPGLVDFSKGVVYDLTNVKGWKDTPVKRILENKLKMPVLADNDVNVMALGECKFGAGKGAVNAVCITLGTGVGGGVIIGGGLYRGSTFSAGEVGHMPLKDAPAGLKCNCGGYGCLERYVGNRHISQEYRSMKKGKVPLMSPESISIAAKKGDRAAIELWDRVGSRIGTTLAGIVNLLNPEIIIVGGGVSEAGERLFGPMREAVKKRAMKIPGGAVRIVKAKLGNDAGVIGAAALFF
ncbi:MAG TPA: ROK family protein [Candidatus Omnitrophota bacterium]|nr:ROK family protein [Candidatus Omnitrophota bacterium]